MFQNVEVIILMPEKPFQDIFFNTDKICEEVELKDKEVAHFVKTSLLYTTMLLIFFY